MSSLYKWGLKSVDNPTVDNYPFHTQLIRQRGTGLPPLSPVVVILCTQRDTWAQGSYPQKDGGLAFISFTEKL
ncbi:hypothetical protein PflQ2_5710 [Pseudomonas fluorescens Q2-87]|uniref:Uncharacterized protein n=1 Tax=Pseudomonas fluorescens (strain Q2-87) TaxID=1038922 RepID=J2XV62_PSEFQ|nr:hypothetical protein PflQ2_5710 [Pseudomonas fluorescens Q2-87]